MTPTFYDTAHFFQGVDNTHKVKVCSLFDKDNLLTDDYMTEMKTIQQSTHSLSA